MASTTITWAAVTPFCLLGFDLLIMFIAVSLTQDNDIADVKARMQSIK